jgi:hypothetical protein
MKPIIDKKMCKFCDFGDKGNEGLCISKMLGGNCKFER